MDYIDFPRKLIYKERRSLEDFVEENEENSLFIDNMLDNYYYSSTNGKERALRCFNTAYYLCTIILQSKSRPEWNFAKYCDIAYCDEIGNNANQAFTLSLVYIFLTHTSYEVSCNKLLKKLLEYLYNTTHAIIRNNPFYDDYYYNDAYNELKKGLPDNFLITEEFILRKIDKDIFKEIDGPGDLWSRLTNHYDKQEVRKIVDFIGKDEEEKHVLIDLISRDAQRYYGGNSYYHETLKPILDDMDQLIYNEYTYAADQALLEAQIEELRYQGDIRPLQKRIAELESQLNSPQLNSSKQKYDCNTETTEEMNSLLAENEELTLAVQSYKDQGKGLTTPEAAILITAICLELNQIPANGREGLAPIIEFCWGKSNSTSSEGLRRKVTKKSAEKLACKFELLTPKIARLIRELPQKLEDRNNERLIQINPNVNK